MLKYYFRNGYNSKEVAAAIGNNHGVWKSVRAMQRHLRYLKLHRQGGESNVDLIISTIKNEVTGVSRNLGVRQIWKRLRRRYGLLVRRQTVREIVDIIEPTRRTETRKSRLQRRVYCVQGPNQVWHIDGNDKLKPYGFCISGAIDGWSRYILWLDVDTTNSDPNLICTYFLSVVEKLELVPRTVIIDKGTEHVGIAVVQTLLRQDHDDNSVPVMVGSSNHNQRIERWWGYCRKSILQCYMDLFKDLEVSGILQMNNVLHMECLKFCFMNTLRNELTIHANICNEHRVRNVKQTRCPSGKLSYAKTYMTINAMSSEVAITLVNGP